METAQELKTALEATRNQYGGITLDLIARIMISVFDEAEARALINELSKYNDERTEQAKTF